MILSKGIESGQGWGRSRSVNGIRSYLFVCYLLRKCVRGEAKILLRALRPTLDASQGLLPIFMMHERTAGPGRTALNCCFGKVGVSLKGRIWNLAGADPLELSDGRSSRSSERKIVRVGVGDSRIQRAKASSSLAFPDSLFQPPGRETEQAGTKKDDGSRFRVSDGDSSEGKPLDRKFVTRRLWVG